MKGKIIFVLVLFIAPSTGFSQSAEASFHIASNQYIHGKMDQARMTLDAALARYPNDKKLRELRDQIKEEQQQNQPENQEQQEQQNNEKQEGESKEKDEQGKDEQSENSDKEEQNKEGEEKEGDQEEKEADQQQQEEKAGEKEKNDEKKKGDPNLDMNKLRDMKIPEEKARMILEAMRMQEKQYLQQNRRKGTQPKDRSKPDW